MALVFPLGPAIGQQFTGTNGIVYEWTSIGAWDKVNSVQTARSGPTASTSSARIPVGNTAERPSPSLVAGQFRYNNQIPQLEYSDGTTWLPVSGASILPASLAEAQAGIITTKYSSPETAVPKDASGMTGSAYLPAGTTAQRPTASNYTGQFRYNTQIPQLEYSNGTAWLPVGGSSILPASLPQAQAGTLTSVYSSPETAVPKDASGMTGAALIPTGSVAQRPGTPVIGMVRFNTDTSYDPSGRLEVHTEDSVWRPLAYLETPTVPPPNLTFSSSANVGGVYYCNNLLISAGVTLTVTSGITVVFVCTGNAVINGSILANDQVGRVTDQFNGGGTTSGGSLFVNYVPGIGYGTSGSTYSSLITAAGSSPGSGRTQASFGASTTASIGGGGGGGIIIRSSGVITQAAGSTLSANGGNATPGTITVSTGLESLAGSGGGSGGLVSLRGDLGLSIAGNILVRGANGANGTNTNPAGVACAGGGGGGGWVILQTGGTLTNSATITLTGGAGGTASGAGSSAVFRGLNGAGYSGAGGSGGQSAASADGATGATGAIIKTGSPI